MVAPTVIMLVYSFAARHAGRRRLGFTLENYAAVFEPLSADRVRSIVFAGLTTSLCLVAGYPVAYYIGRAAARWRNCS